MFNAMSTFNIHLLKMIVLNNFNNKNKNHKNNEESTADTHFSSNIA